MQEALRVDHKLTDLSPLLKTCAQEFGHVGFKIAMEQIEMIERGLMLNPYSTLRYTEWQNVEQLDTLFSSKECKPEYGKFIDQRFINYLRANTEKIDTMHWRKFEQLTAEYFDRNGYRVELGSGQNDDGIDIRIWKENGNDKSELPHCIIQCKRQKRKIEKTVVKGLYADIEFAGAKRGLLVTTSELSRGAKRTIRIRSYPEVIR